MADYDLCFNATTVSLIVDRMDSWRRENDEGRLDGRPKEVKECGLNQTLCRNGPLLFHVGLRTALCC